MQLQVAVGSTDGIRSAELHALRSRVVVLTQLAAGKNPETNEAECGKVCESFRHPLEAAILVVL